MIDGWTYSNAAARPLTLDDIRQAAEKLRPVGDEMREARAVGQDRRAGR